MLLQSAVYVYTAVVCVYAYIQVNLWRNNFRRPFTHENVPKHFEASRGFSAATAELLGFDSYTNCMRDVSMLTVCINNIASAESFPRVRSASVRQNTCVLLTVTLLFCFGV